ncbi:MAG TPA: STAS domain-containing protein [Nevskiaceae bacterium]|nr:STAS domain-containing protein [Nevskiaceae bacterium]
MADTYRTAANGARLTVYLTGEIDMDRSPEVRKALVAAVGQGRALTVDMAGVDYMDSSGIACLVLAYQQANTARLDFELANVQPRVRKVLELARLDKVFRIV